MKKKISGMLLIVTVIFSLAGCGKKVPLADQVEEYELAGTADNTACWRVVFNEDCDLVGDYSYSDFIDIIEHCMGRSKNLSTTYVSVYGYDSEEIIRFSWDQSYDPYIITEKDGPIDNLRTYEWNLTAEEYNEIRDARK